LQRNDQNSVADPWPLGLGTDPRIHDSDEWILDPDPAIFVIDLQAANKKQIFFLSFSAHFF
jgi:hypothetical protein